MKCVEFLLDVYNGVWTESGVYRVILSVGDDLKFFLEVRGETRWVYPSGNDHRMADEEYFKLMCTGGIGKSSISDHIFCYYSEEEPLLQAFSNLPDLIRGMAVILTSTLFQPSDKGSSDGTTTETFDEAQQEAQVQDFYKQCLDKIVANLKEVEKLPVDKL